MPIEQAVLRMTVFALFSVTMSAADRVGPITSVSGGSNVSAAGGSFLPVFSGDGRYIAYLSYVNNLVTNDGPGLKLDVFLTDWLTGATRLVSTNITATGGANADCFDISVSFAGSWIAFTSRASDLVTNDLNDAVDVFLQGLGDVSGRYLVSANRFGRSPPDPVPFAARPLSSRPHVAAASWLPTIAFDSIATNMTGIPDTNNARDVFISGIILAFPLMLVSVAHDGSAAADGSSHSPSLSSDEGSLAFVSTATNLVPIGPANRGGDIYVRKLDLHRTYWASPRTRDLLVGAFPAPPSFYQCFNHALSGNGGAVVYQANVPNSISSNVLLYCEVGSTSAVRIATDSDLIGRPQISDDGRFVAFSSRSNVYVWDRTTGSNTLVSVSTNGTPGNGPSYSPVMPREGGYVAFLSRASDLVPFGVSNRFQVYLRDLNRGLTHLVSVNTNGFASESNYELSNLAIPESDHSGMLVAFDTTAADLVTNDFNGASDIFVWHVGNRRPQLVSRRAAVLNAATAAPMNGISPNSVSADGRIVAFTSFDNPLIPHDTNIWQDVFIRDVVSGDLQRATGPLIGRFWSHQAALEPKLSAAGTHLVYLVERGPSPYDKNVFWYDLRARSNVLVSVTISGDLPNISPKLSEHASISSQGNLVIFQSTVPAETFSSNLPDPNGFASDVFGRDMTTGEMKLISVDYTGTRSGNGASSNPVLSPNDRWVAFQSDAGNIVYVLADGSVGGLPPGYLYARDLLSNTSRVASVGRNSLGSNVAVAVRGPAVFSGDSEWIGYVVTNNEVYVRNLLNGATRPVCDSCGQPRLSHDARFVAYQTLTNNGPTQVWVKDTLTGIAKLMSANSSGSQGNGTSSSPQISPNGRFVVFQSLASDLVANDTNNASDIFVADRLLGSVVLLTINRTGTASANGSSTKPVLSAEGGTVVFQSLASDLITGDYNDRRDVFYATLSLPDSDGDGMDDDFEITYFGNLDRNGAGDMDNDGQTDLQEFLGGTNPTSDTSILRVITLNLTGSDTRQLIWSAVPGRTYLVQYKDDLNDPWSTLPGTTRAISTTATRSDSASGPHRYYRVLVAD